MNLISWQISLFNQINLDITLGIQELRNYSLLGNVELFYYKN